MAVVYIRWAGETAILELQMSRWTAEALARLLYEQPDVSFPVWATAELTDAQQLSGLRLVLQEALDRLDREEARRKEAYGTAGGGGHEP
jgi:hypothetical protein